MCIKEDNFDLKGSETDVTGIFKTIETSPVSVLVIFNPVSRMEIGTRRLANAKVKCFWRVKAMAHLPDLASIRL